MKKTNFTSIVVQKICMTLVLFASLTFPHNVFAQGHRPLVVDSAFWHHPNDSSFIAHHDSLGPIHSDSGRTWHDSGIAFHDSGKIRNDSGMVRCDSAHSLFSTQDSGRICLDSGQTGNDSGFKGHHTGENHRLANPATPNTGVAVNITIYPNPVVESATVHIENAQDVITFKMYELNGKLAMEKTFSNGDFQLDRSNVGAGVYIYDVSEGNTKIYSGKLIFQ